MTWVILMTLTACTYIAWICQDADKLRRRLNRRVRVPYSRCRQTRRKEV